jgi:hypothetical protein
MVQALQESPWSDTVPAVIGKDFTVQPLTPPLKHQLDVNVITQAESAAWHRENMDIQNFF